MSKNKLVKIPDIKSLISKLLATPSISCTSEDLDQGNIQVINQLADWLENFGFHCEVQHL